MVSHGERFLRCCGVRIDLLSRDAAVQDILTPRRGGRPGRAVHLCNAYTLALASADPGYSAMLNRGEANLADGASVVRVARIAGSQILDNASRPRGMAVLMGTVTAGLAAGTRHYLYGASPETVEAMAAQLRAGFPDVQLVGVESPPFRDLRPDEERALIDRFRHTAPDVVWVGLGTPRQDWFVDAMAEHIEATFVAVGAAFDFVAGTKREAPVWVQRSGLEWVFRLVSEPRRLWRRYLIGNVRFLVAARGSRLVAERPVDST